MPRHVEPRVIRDEMSYDQAALAETLQSRVDSLNTKQRLFYDAVVSSVENNQGRLFALQASGGTG